MEHYSQGDPYSVCTNTIDQNDRFDNLTAEDIETIRRLPSFRGLIESIRDCRTVIAMFENDQATVNHLKKITRNVHIYFRMFYCILRVLQTMVQDLPKNFLGKQLRDLYAKCITTPVIESQEFKDMWQLLSFLSKDEMITLLQKVIDTLAKYKKDFCADTDIVSVHVAKHIQDVSTLFFFLNRTLNNLMIIFFCF